MGSSSKLFLKSDLKIDYFEIFQKTNQMLKFLLSVSRNKNDLCIPEPRGNSNCASRLWGAKLSKSLNTSDVYYKYSSSIYKFFFFLILIITKLFH